MIELLISLYVKYDLAELTPRSHTLHIRIFTGKEWATTEVTYEFLEEVESPEKYIIHDIEMQLRKNTVR